MRYHNITKDDMLNGDGIRVVLWVSGCKHHCKGCQNPETWSPNHGLVFDSNAFAEICEELNKDYVSGLTISGGDPLHPLNINTVASICIAVKKLFPKKNIWLYTGYDYDIVKNAINLFLTKGDVVVDGEYIQGLKKAQWVGSENQRVIRL